MGRRKKKTWRENLGIFISSHPRWSLLILAILIVACYPPWHALSTYRDTQKFHQTRTAIDDVYNAIALKLGQPSNVKSISLCSRQSALLRATTTCRAETDFVYGVYDQPEANLLLTQIQKVIGQSPSFKATKKLSTSLSDSLVVSNYYHDALDSYSGPHHIACSVKYSYDTADEITLSLYEPGKKAFEVFFACSAKASHFVYPAA